MKMRRCIPKALFAVLTVQAQGWKDRKAARRSWFEREKVRLRADIVALATPGGGTGVAATDAKIREWAPQCLPAAGGGPAPGGGV